jgi:hypothetical protein
VERLERRLDRATARHAIAGPLGVGVRSEAEFALALRQQRLLLRSEALRDAVATQATVLRAPLAAADRVRAVARWLDAHRAWVAGAAVVLVVVRPRRAWRIARLGWWLWRTTRRAQTWLAVLAPTARQA